MRARWIIVALSVLSLSLGAAWAAEKAARKPVVFTYGPAGFAMDVPDMGNLPAHVPVAIFYAPPQGEFAPNVNVILQPVKTTREQYLATTLEELKQTRAAVHQEEKLEIDGRPALRLDYEATMQDRNLRFLSLAVIEPTQVVLVTCTAPAENFAAYEPAFRKCLASFRYPK